MAGEVRADANAQRPVRKEGRGNKFSEVAVTSLQSSRRDPDTSALRDLVGVVPQTTCLRRAF